MNNLARFVEIAKYSQRKSLYGRENLTDMITRVMNMHRNKYKDAKIPESYWQQLEKFMLQKKVLPSLRSLQFAGPAIMKHNARIYNCSASYMDDPRRFGEILYLLFCGVGCGFSVQKQHVEKLPNFHHPIGPKIIYKAVDSIEGWSNCVSVLISSYCGAPFPEYHNKRIQFDLTGIRKTGSAISSCNSKAAGPERLFALIENIKKVIKPAAEVEFEEAEEDIMSEEDIAIAQENAKITEEASEFPAELHKDVVEGIKDPAKANDLFNALTTKCKT